jgi:hypothetical protein
MDQRVFEETPCLKPALEFLTAEKVIIPAVHLTRPRRPGGAGN